jgi:cell division protein FtsB
MLAKLAALRDLSGPARRRPDLRGAGSRRTPGHGKLTSPGGVCERRDVRRFSRIVERTLPIGVLVMAAVGAPVMIFSPQGLPRLRQLESELADVQEENAALGREIEALRGRVARLRDDPTAVERIARDNLGFVRQSEVIFQFPR